MNAPKGSACVLFYQTVSEQVKLPKGRGRNKATNMAIGAGKALVTAMTAAALAALAACETTEPPKAQDMEFVRGCWVSKDLPGGPPTAFLRLLPDGASGPTYAGSIIDVRDGKWNPGVRFEFSRDGSRVVVTRPDNAAQTYLRTESHPPRPASDASARVVYTDGRKLLIAAGGDDTLVIQEGTSSPVTLWEFERDGCD
jgi:hypothetical protein